MRLHYGEGEATAITLGMAGIRVQMHADKGRGEEFPEFGNSWNIQCRSLVTDIGSHIEVLVFVPWLPTQSVHRPGVRPMIRPVGRVFVTSKREDRLF
jgi:hypothetical protein